MSWWANIANYFSINKSEIIISGAEIILVTVWRWQHFDPIKANSKGCCGGSEVCCGLPWARASACTHLCTNLPGLQHCSLFYRQKRRSRYRERCSWAQSCLESSKHCATQMFLECEIYWAGFLFLLCRTTQVLVCNFFKLLGGNLLGLKINFVLITLLQCNEE